jgi:F-type H+/Na+-transporting ATPase subunit alpha
MALNIKEISEIIERQIKNYGQEVVESEEGTVITVGDGVALIYGLDKAMMGELLLFPHEVYGMVLNLEEGAIGAVIVGNDVLIKEGDTVRRTGKVVETPVGNQMLGRVVNALGQPIDDQGQMRNQKTRPVERIATGVMARKSVDQPLETGLLAIDATIPIGRGQRELIIGDRQTGKTAIAIDAIVNQKGKEVKCVYVSIGQKDSTIAQVVEKLKKNGAMEYTTIVNAGASEAAPLQYLAPYTGVTIAEE